MCLNLDFLSIIFLILGCKITTPDDQLVRVVFAPDDKEIS